MKFFAWLSKFMWGECKHSFKKFDETKPTLYCEKCGKIVCKHDMELIVTDKWPTGAIYTYKCKHCGLLQQVKSFGQ